MDALGLEIRNVAPRRARPVVGEQSLQESEWETRDAELKRHVHAESIVDRTSLPKKGSVVAATYDCHGGREILLAYLWYCSNRYAPYLWRDSERRR